MSIVQIPDKQRYMVKKNLAPSSILREAKVAYYARNMFEAGRFVLFFVKATLRHAMNPLR